MTANVLDHARAALALGESIEKGKSPIFLQEGDLQGRKVIPLAFHLHITVAVIGAIAAVALTITAIALSIFTLYIATAACLLLVLSNSMGAFCCYSFAPEEELITLISKLSDKIFNMGTLGAEISLTKIVEEGRETTAYSDTQKLRNENDKLKRENEELQRNLRKIEATLTPENRLRHSYSIDIDEA